MFQFSEEILSARKLFQLPSNDHPSVETVLKIMLYRDVLQVNVLEWEFDTKHAAGKSRGKWVKLPGNIYLARNFFQLR